MLLQLFHGCLDVVLSPEVVEKDAVSGLEEVGVEVAQAILPSDTFDIGSVVPGQKRVSLSVSTDRQSELTTSSRHRESAS